MKAQVIFYSALAFLIQLAASYPYATDLQRYSSPYEKRQSSEAQYPLNSQRSYQNAGQRSYDGAYNHPAPQYRVQEPLRPNQDNYYGRNQKPYSSIQPEVTTEQYVNQQRIPSQYYADNFQEPTHNQNDNWRGADDGINEYQPVKVNYPEVTVTDQQYHNYPQPNVQHNRYPENEIASPAEDAYYSRPNQLNESPHQEIINHQVLPRHDPTNSISLEDISQLNLPQILLDRMFGPPIPPVPTRHIYSSKDALQQEDHHYLQVEPVEVKHIPVEPPLSASAVQGTPLSASERSLAHAGNPVETVPEPLAQPNPANSVLSNPRIQKVLSTTKHKKRYLVIHPNGTVEHVDSLETVSKQHPNYVLVNAGKVVPHAGKNGSAVTPPIQPLVEHTAVNNKPIPTLKYEPSDFKLDVIVSKPTTHSPKAIPTSIPKPAPEIPKPAPEIPKPAPEIPKPAPETPNPAPKIPKPATEIPEPATEIPKPAPEIPKPASEIPQPAPEIPKPAPEIPKPAQEIPKPAPETPKPAPKIPKLAPEIPKPAPEIPKPAHEKPKPAPVTPKPAPEILKPAPEVPKPAPEIPKPAHEIPKPAPETPKPAPATSKSELETPQPAPATSKPAPIRPKPEPETPTPAPATPKPECVTKKTEPITPKIEPVTPNTAPATPTPTAVTEPVTPASQATAVDSGSNATATASANNGTNTTSSAQAESLSPAPVEAHTPQATTKPTPPTPLPSNNTTPKSSIPESTQPAKAEVSPPFVLEKEDTMCQPHNKPGTTACAAVMNGTPSTTKPSAEPASTDKTPQENVQEVSTESSTSPSDTESTSAPDQTTVNVLELDDHRQEANTDFATTEAPFVISYESPKDSPNNIDEFVVNEASNKVTPNPSELVPDLGDSSVLEHVPHKPVVWFRTSDPNFWKKLSDKNTGLDVVYFFQIHNQPKIVYDTKTTVFPNGTISEEITETTWDFEGDEPKVKKTTKITNPGEQ